MTDFLLNLEKLQPKTYPLWYARTYGDPSHLYEDDPMNNCSVEGHKVAPDFARFIAPRLRGRVLDIGCGPQATPLYLEGYPPAMISGIDPLWPTSYHNFEFAQGVAEFLPWDDATFDTVITGTSLDHVLDLARAMDELARVLKPGGLYMAWEHIFSDVPPYVAGVPHAYQDECHLFKFGPWFFDWLEARGLVLGLQGPGMFAFQKKEDAARRVPNLTNVRFRSGGTNETSSAGGDGNSPQPDDDTLQQWHNARMGFG